VALPYHSRDSWAGTPAAGLFQKELGHQEKKSLAEAVQALDSLLPRPRRREHQHIEQALQLCVFTPGIDTIIMAMG
jgi:hypothetical protein